MFVWTFSGVIEAIILSVCLVFFALCGAIVLLEKLQRKFRRKDKE